MKKVLFIVVPLFVLGGGFVGLAVMGVINVPGLTPKKPKPAAMYGEEKDKAEKPKTTPAPKPREPVTPREQKSKLTLDPEKGAKKLAGLWNSVPSDKLLEMTKQFKDTELAPIFVAMDPEKVSELLGAMDAKRSAKLSKALQQAASVVQPQ